MQFFSADITMFLIFFAQENMKKTPPKFGYYSLIAEIFSAAGQTQNQPKSQILFHKNDSPRDVYIMTLVGCFLLPY